MNCRNFRKRYVELLDADLGVPGDPELAVHLESCPECAGFYEEMLKSFSAVKPSRKVIATPQFKERIMKKIEKIDQTGPQKTSKFRTARTKLWKPALATAIVVLVLAIVSLINWIGQRNGLGPISPFSALAHAAEQIRSARTLTFTMITHMEGQPTMQMEMAYKEPGYYRMTMPDGSVGIFDLIQEKGITILKAKKQFVEINYYNLPSYRTQVDQIEQLRTLPDRADEILDKREIKGLTVQGFRVNENGMNKIVWVDVDTGNLIRVEGEFPRTPGIQTVLTDFQFNVDLDDSLFSLAPPEGYTPLEIEVDAQPSERHLIYLLRFWATYARDNMFPPTLNPIELAKSKDLLNGLKLSSSEGKNPPELTEEEQLQATLQITYGVMFVMQMKAENDWHYAGKGVSLDSADIPIFWWKPDGTETYRIIYGDLTVRDVESGELPEVQQ